jgi:hypothetical protein
MWGKLPLFDPVWVERADAESHGFGGTKTRIEKREEKRIVGKVNAFAVRAKISAQAPMLAKSEFEELVALILTERIGTRNNASDLKSRPEFFEMRQG